MRKELKIQTIFPRIMWYDETIKNMAFQRDKVLGSCMTEDEEEAKMLNAILDELKRSRIAKIQKSLSVPNVYPISSHLVSSSSRICPFVEEVLCSRTIAPGWIRVRSLSKASSLVGCLS